MPGCHWPSSNYSVPTSCICKPALGCSHWAYTSSPQTASTYSWLCHTGFLLQCSALGKGLLIENQRSSVRASLGIRDAAIIWPLFQQGCDVKDLRPQARLSRQTVSASVGSRGQPFFFFFFVFFCQWSDIYKEMRPMFLSQAFETSALRMLLCNWVTVALKEMVMCIRPSLPLGGKKITSQSFNSN